MLVTGSAWAAGPAGIKLDGTLGPSAAALVGPMYNITQNLGKLSGGNLFFSFQYFNVATNEIATFYTTSAGINNVISRVTGGYGSSIDGTIRLAAASGAPNFFLINPAGVTFTANAQINVPAAFYVSTANYLKFSDGNFYVNPSKMSTLSASAPEAFGFLGTTRAPVNIQGATPQAGAVGEGDFQIVAGDVTLDGLGNAGGISNGSGDVRVVAVGSEATQVPLSGPFNATDGTVTLQNGGLIQTSGGPAAAAGGIYLSAGTLQVDGGASSAGSALVSSAGGIRAGPIIVDVTGNAMFTNGGGIASYALNGGAGASITLNAGSLTIQGVSSTTPTGILSYTNSAGDSGTINVRAGTLDIDGTGVNSSDQPTGILSEIDVGSAPAVLGGAIVVHVIGAARIVNGGEVFLDTYGAGSDGDVTLTAGSLTIDGGTSTVVTGIASEADQGSSGSAGQVSVTTTDALILSNGGQIEANTYSVGNAGNVLVTASSLSIARGKAASFTGISSSAEGDSSGNAGKVAVTTTGPVTISNGGQILTDTYASGNAGDISLALGALSIDGTAASFTGVSSSAASGSSGNSGRVSVTTTGAITLLDGAAIATDTHSSGNAGSVVITASSLSIDGGSSAIGTGINSATDTSSSGNAGQVSVATTGALTLSNGGQITTDANALGNAGNVNVTAGSLVIIGTSSAKIGTGISSAAASGSSGQTGTINIDAGTLVVGTNGLVSISNDATVVNPTGIKSTQINIQAQNIQMTGGQINAQSTGDIDASSIDIHFGSSLRMDPSEISTSAVDGNGGPITITGSGPLLIDHSNITTSVLGTSNGDGGNISINAPVIVLDTGAIQANTFVRRASGGSVTINAQALVPSFESYYLGGGAIDFLRSAPGLNVVQAANPDGVNAPTSVTAPTLDLGNALLGLTGHPVAPETVGRGLCGITQQSSLTVAGHGGVAPTAFDPLWIDPEQAWHEATIESNYTAVAATTLPLSESEILFTCR